MWQHLSMATLTGPQMSLGWLAAEGQDGSLSRISLHMYNTSRNTGCSKYLLLGLKKPNSCGAHVAQ